MSCKWYEKLNTKKSEGRASQVTEPWRGWRGKEWGKGRGSGGGGWGGGQSAKFVERRTLMLCVVWKMTCFPGPDGSFFRVLLAFSDWADFARILLSMLEPGARAPAFSPMRVDTAVQAKGCRVSGGSKLVLLGTWKGDSGSQSHHSIKWANLGSPFGFSLWFGREIPPLSCLRTGAADGWALVLTSCVGSEGG